MARHDNVTKLSIVPKKPPNEYKLLYIIIILQIIELGLRIYGK